METAVDSTGQARVARRCGGLQTGRWKQCQSAQRKRRALAITLTEQEPVKAEASHG